MKNLEQHRAKNALKASVGTGAEGGDSVSKKVPAMIRENGFLGAMAFAKEKGAGYADVFNAIIAHLADIGQLHGLPANFDGFLAGLCDADAATLRAVTAESLAYLNYLRRFQ
ncbi:MAG: type III-B CRISPR module-associated protein Cmr5 [Puniceicoccales bacterium]|jgi:CRISPR/Cas system CMR-associated protein Cmr5 small subunit|nr:type III-B CRISPR module-associated protein Cmr5 [Puniceicoccales bacterium]